jgi:DNA-binding response OmpR family regulator
MADEKKATILVVEDEIPAALALGAALEHEGYTVLRAADGEEGLKVALEKHPDLMLVDLKMPKMNGMDMIHALRADAWGKGAKVIILTNVSDMGSLQAAMMNDTFYYLVKSDTSVADVLRSVEVQLKGKQ